MLLAGFDAKTLNLIFLSLVLVIIFFSIIWGLIRGFKKTTFRTLWLIAFAIAFFFLTPIITNAVINFNLSSFNLTINSIKVTSIKQFIVDYVSSINDIGAVAIANPEVAKIIDVLPGMIVNPILFTLLFWLTKDLLWFIWAIIAKFVCPKYTDKTKTEKTKKHRSLGALVGVVTGFLICSVTFVPVAGISDLACSIDKIKDEKTNLGALENLAGKDVASYLKAYDSSIAKQILTYTGMDYISMAMFNKLSSSTINNKKVQLKDEVLNLFETYIIAKDFSSINLSTLTKEEANVWLFKTKVLINKIFNVKTLTYLGDNALPSILEEVINNKNFSIQVPKTNIKQINNAIVEMLKVLQKEQNIFTNLQTDLLNMVDVLITLNNNDLLIPILNKQISTTELVNKLSTNEKLLKDLNNGLFNIPKFSKFTPIIINNAMLYAGEQLNFNVEENKELSGAVVQDAFYNILSNTLNVYNNAFKNNSKTPEINKEVIQGAGLLLQNIKTSNLVTKTTFSNLIQAVTEKAQQEVLKINLDENLKNALSIAVGNIPQISNFQTEFNQFANVYADALDLYNSINNGFNIKTFNFAKVGIVLDDIKNTTLFGTEVQNKTTFQHFFSAGITFASNSVTNGMKETTPEEIKLKQAFKDLFISIDNQFENVESWTAEFETLDSVKTNISIISENTNDLIGFLKSQNSEVVVGSTLDALLGKNETTNKNNFNLITKESLNKFINVLLTNVENNPKTDKILKSVISAIKDGFINVDNWTNEIKLFKNLLNIDTDNLNYKELGKNLNAIQKDSKIFENKLTPLVKDLLQISLDSVTGDNKELKTITNKILYNLDVCIANNTLIDYETEFVNLENLTNNINEMLTVFQNEDVLNNLNNEKLKTALANIGTTLDNISNSNILKGISKDVVLMLFNKIETINTDENFIAIISTIKTNVNTIFDNHKTPCTHILTTEYEKLVDLVTQLNNMLTLIKGEKDIKALKEPLLQIAKSLDNYSNDDPNNLLNGCPQQIVLIMFDNIAKRNTNPTFKGLILDLKNNIKNVFATNKTNPCFQIMTDLFAIFDNVEKITNTIGNIKPNDINSIKNSLDVIPELYGVLSSTIISKPENSKKIISGGLDLFNEKFTEISNGQPQLELVKPDIQKSFEDIQKLNFEDKDKTKTEITKIITGLKDKFNFSPIM